MSKLKELGIALLVGIIGLTITGSASSFKGLKDSIDLCNLPSPGTKGYVKGVVVDNRKDEWSHSQLSTIKEGKEGCPLIIKHRNNVYLKQPSYKVKALVKIDSEGFAELLENRVEEDLTVLDENGEVTPTKYVEFKLSKPLTQNIKSNSTFTLTVNDNKRYYFTKEVSRPLEPHRMFRWYYQENQRGQAIVTRVEPI